MKFDANEFEKELPGLTFNEYLKNLQLYNNVANSSYKLDLFHEEEFFNGLQQTPNAYHKTIFRLSTIFHYGNVKDITIQFNTLSQLKIPDQTMKYTNQGRSVKFCRKMKENSLEVLWFFNRGNIESKIFKYVFIEENEITHIIDEYLQDHGNVYSYHIYARFKKVRRSIRKPSEKFVLPILWHHHC